MVSESIGGGSAHVNDVREFTDDVAVDGGFDGAGDAVDGRATVVAAATELGEGEAPAELARGAGVGAEEVGLAEDG